MGTLRVIRALKRSVKTLIGFKEFANINAAVKKIELDEEGKERSVTFKQLSPLPLQQVAR